MADKQNEESRERQAADYELCIMRHGIAAERSSTAILDDSKRPLTSEGKEKMREIACGLASIGLKPDWIVSSPLVRAVETAEVVAEAFDPNPPLERCDALRPGGEPEALLTFLAKRPTRRRAIVVGHEPDLGELAARLIGAGRSANMPFKKGGCCLISFTEFPPKTPGRLAWWLPPRILRRLG